jgi:hypothetical protein
VYELVVAAGTPMNLTVPVPFVETLVPGAVLTGEQPKSLDALVVLEHLFLCFAYQPTAQALSLPIRRYGKTTQVSVVTLYSDADRGKETGFLP